MRFWLRETSEEQDHFLHKCSPNAQTAVITMARQIKLSTVVNKQLNISIRTKITVFECFAVQGAKVKSLGRARTYNQRRDEQIAPVSFSYFSGNNCKTFCTRRIVNTQLYAAAKSFVLERDEVKHVVLGPRRGTEM